MIHLIPQSFACALGTPNFFGFPHWYGYLDGVTDGSGKCAPSISGINDVWLIVAAVIEIMLRIAAMAAVIFVIYAGVSYIVSQGEPDKTGKAKGTLINALIGLAISVFAAFIITFIAEGIK